MATLLNNGDIVLMRVWATLGNQAAVNSYGFVVAPTSGPSVTDQDFADDIATAVTAFMTSLMPPDATYNGLQVYLLKHPAILPAPVKNTIGAGPGTVGTASLPRVAAGIMKYNTLARGPGGRGRVYLPFVSGSYCDTNGEPNNAYDVLVNSWASALLTPRVVTVGGGSATFTWSLVRRKKGSPVTAAQIVQGESADKFGQMHKRGDYGRSNASPV